MRRAVNAEFGLVKSAYIGAAPVVGVVKSVEKQVVVPAAAAPTQATVQANATTNVVTIPGEQLWFLALFIECDRKF